MAKPAPNRTAQLAQIHIAKKELGLDDDTYRAVLWACARVKSSADLDYAGRARVLDHFKAKGFKPKPAKKAKSSVNLSSEPQHKMIRGLWLELHNNGQVLNSSESAINRFIKNQTRIDRIEWLSTYQASQVIESLKRWIARTTKGDVSNGQQ